MKERRALFEKWLAANIDAFRNAWDRTQVLHAQADLRSAMAVALTYRVDHAGFAGLTPSEAEAIDPGLSFNVTETVVGAVSIRVATQGSVLLTTESRSGQMLCMAHESDGVSYGTKDAKTVAGCDGGGWLTSDASPDRYSSRRKDRSAGLSATSICAFWSLPE